MMRIATVILFVIAAKIIKWAEIVAIGGTIDTDGCMVMAME